MIDDKEKERGEDWMDVFDTFHSLFRTAKKNQEMKAKNLIGFMGGGGVSDDDAEAFFARRVAAGDPVPSTDKQGITQFFIDIKATMGVDGVTSIYDSLDFFVLEATYSKAAALVNMLNVNFNGTITNDHGASFSAYLGLLGSNADQFRVNTGYNPGDGGGPYKFTINNGCAGVLILSDENGDFFDLSGLNSTGANGTYIEPRRGAAAHYDFAGAMSSTSFINTITTPYCYGWFDIRKTAANTEQVFVNGMLCQLPGATSQAVPNSEWKEFAAFTTVYSGWSSKYHGARYAGNANINPTILHGLVYKNLLKNTSAVAQAKVGKRVLCIGDSMTGDPGSGSSASAISEYPRRVATTLGNGWGIVQNGIQGRTLSTINGTLATAVSPFRNTYFDKDIVVMWAGTNDMASSSSITAADMMTLYDTFKNTLVALGFKVITVGTIDRNATFTGGQNQAGFDSVRAGLRTLALAAYPTATAVTNVYTDGTSYYVDAFANAKFADASDLTYFQADTIHLNTTGYDAIADEMIIPAIQLI